MNGIKFCASSDASTLISNARLAAETPSRFEAPSNPQDRAAHRVRRETASMDC